MSPAVPIVPRWMIVWPFDPKTAELPTIYKATGAYIMWSRSPHAHVHMMERR
jgi:hypothetical protein